ncbi:hypothetical protein [Lacihabitans lacunae]|uniref:DUF5655 domain-containing protein n=1 Tax=Lacihabitans lacunae TaxID=1028214 RepID=A0ABV7YTM9_9BACT
MTNTQTEIFEAFKRNIIGKINPYLSNLGFITENVIKEEQQWISAKFIKRATIISFSLSLHHLDYADGIIVSLKSKFGDKFLRNEVLKKSNKEISVYLYGLDIIDSEFDRILNDIIIHFEKQLNE